MWSLTLSEQQGCGKHSHVSSLDTTVPNKFGLSELNTQYDSMSSLGPAVCA